MVQIGKEAISRFCWGGRQQHLSQRPAKQGLQKDPKEAGVPSSLHHWLEKTHGSGSPPTPATTRESLIPRSTDTTGSQELDHTMISGSQRQLDSQKLWYTQDLRIIDKARLWVLTQPGSQKEQAPVKDSAGR